MGAAWDRQQGLTDHTIDTSDGIVAGYILKSSGAVVGYLWLAPSGQTWMWRSADGFASGERQTKKAAVETLHDVRAVKTGRLRAGRPPLPKPLATYTERIIKARPIATFAQSAPEPVAPPVRQVVWGDNETDGATLTAAIGAAINKHKGRE